VSHIRIQATIKRPLSPPPTNERLVKRVKEDVFAGSNKRIPTAKKTNTKLQLVHKIIDLLAHPEICVACYALGIDGVAHDLGSCRGGVATYTDPNWKAFRDQFNFRYGRDCMGCGISKDVCYLFNYWYLADILVAYLPRRSQHQDQNSTPLRHGSRLRLRRYHPTSRLHRME
jgi:hypothetical protein